MSYAQFGYAAFTPTTQLMVANTNTSSVSSPCCAGDSSGRASSGVESSTVCSLPATYDSRLLTTYHPRLYEHQGYPNFTGVESSAFYPSLTTAYGMKDASDPWRGIAPSASYYYDPSLAAYGYGGLDFNGARRKNVTRDSTSTLKAWLNEHRKNPYPTKGEKIMLAIITKMTLTQVSTWFANARRRLKKENKMTWEPRNKMDNDDVKDFDDDDDDDDDRRTRSEKTDDSRTGRCESEDEGDRRGTTSCDSSIDGAAHYASSQLPGRGPYHLSHPRDENKLATTGPHGLDHHQTSPNLIPTSEFTPTDSSSSPNLGGHHLTSPLDGKDPSKQSSEDDSEMAAGRAKPKIWSLADTATSKSPPAASDGTAGSMMDMLGHCGWFSVNPYQVTTGGFGGYHPSASAAAFSSGQCSSSGQGFPQTDTPPQTPPNMKVSSGNSTNYLNAQSGQLYHSPTAGGMNANSAIQGSKSPGSYPLPSHNRTYRSEVLPEDYSATGNFRPNPLQ